MARWLPWERWRIWLAGAICVSWPNAGLLAQEVLVESATCISRPLATQPKIPFDEIPATHREKVRRIVGRPTLCARGPLEVFRGRIDLYQWLLDHPDRGVAAWRRLGAKCGDIGDRGSGRFAWTDGQGSEIHWDTVVRTPRMRIWLAEGSAKPGPFLPSVSVQAVAVLRFSEGRDSLGRPIIQQQGDLYLYTDSKAVALAAELLGQSAQDLAGQAVGQMELFFSAIIWYLERHPECTQFLLAARNDERVTKQE